MRSFAFSGSPRLWTPAPASLMPRRICRSVRSCAPWQRRCSPAATPGDLEHQGRGLAGTTPRAPARLPATTTVIGLVKPVDEAIFAHLEQVMGDLVRCWIAALPDNPRPGAVDQTPTGAPMSRPASSARPGWRSGLDVAVVEEARVDHDGRRDSLSKGERDAVARAARNDLGATRSAHIQFSQVGPRWPTDHPHGCDTGAQSSEDRSEELVRERSRGWDAAPRVREGNPFGEPDGDHQLARWTPGLAWSAAPGNAGSAPNSHLVEQLLAKRHRRVLRGQLDGHIDEMDHHERSGRHREDSPFSHSRIGEPRDAGRR